jgi:hypothetical protein
MYQFAIQTRTVRYSLAGLCYFLLMSATKATTSLRLSDDDQTLLEALRLHFGVSASSEILRMGLHLLARQQGMRA